MEIPKLRPRTPIRMKNLETMKEYGAYKDVPIRTLQHAHSRTHTHTHTNTPTHTLTHTPIYTNVHMHVPIHYLFQRIILFSLSLSYTLMRSPSCLWSFFDSQYWLIRNAIVSSLSFSFFPLLRLTQLFLIHTHLISTISFN